MRHDHVDRMLRIIDRAEDRGGIRDLRKEGKALVHPHRVSRRIKQAVHRGSLAERKCRGLDQRVRGSGLKPSEFLKIKEFNSLS